MSRNLVLISSIPLIIAASVAKLDAENGLDLTAVRIGDPTWKPVDISRFAAPANSLNAFANTLSRMLPNDFRSSPFFQRVNAHDPDDAGFDEELTGGIQAVGFSQASVFSVSDIDGRPNGIFVGWTLVPDPGIEGAGRPSGYFGPVIPGELFPMNLEGDFLREGEVVDPDFDYEQTWPFVEFGGFDGASHMAFVNATNLRFFPEGTEPIGNYEFRTTIRDQNDDGWDIAIPFRVVGGGDLNANEQLDTDDIDLLTLQVRSDNPMTAFDLNGDGMVDEQDRTFWVEELANTWFGDADLDGEFNSGDLVNVFQAGLYEDRLPANATWATGDWNGDLEFESGDFVTAFRHGGFEQGQRTAVEPVPEPSTFGLAWLGFLTVFWRAKK